MSTSTAPTTPTSTSDAPTMPAREGFWARMDRAGTRLVLDDPTMPELPQPADFGTALPWSDGFAAAENARWRRRAWMLSVRGCLRLVVAVVCLVAGVADLWHGRILLGLAEVWTGLVQLVVCWVPLIHAGKIRQDIPYLALHGRSGLGVMLDDAAIEPRLPSATEVAEWDLAADERIWAVLEATTAELQERTFRGLTRLTHRTVPVLVAVTTSRVICRTEAQTSSVPWSRVHGFGARFTAHGGTDLTVWHVEPDGDDFELWQVTVPASMTAHAFSRMSLACATAAGARDAYVAGLATSGVPYRVPGPVPLW